MSDKSIAFLLYYLCIIVSYGHDEPVKICITGSGYANKDGTYEWLYFDSTLNGSVFFQQSNSNYLYPFTWSTNTYRWMISMTAGSTTSFIAYAAHYNPPPFQIEDAFNKWNVWDSNLKQFQPQYSMTVTDCTDVCVSNSDYISLNGIYIWTHFSQVYNSSVYVNNNAGVYLFLYKLDTWINYNWRIGTNASKPEASCACNTGVSNGPTFVFTLDLCINKWNFWNANTAQWDSDSDMIVLNCPHTHAPTYMPTDNPSTTPTNMPTAIPTTTPTTPATPLPTTNPTTTMPTTKVPSKPPTTANPTPAPTDCVSNVNEELDTTTLSGWFVNSSVGLSAIAPETIQIIDDANNCYAVNPCIQIIGNSNDAVIAANDVYIEKILDSSVWNDLTVNVEVKTESLDTKNDEHGFVEIICNDDAPQRTEFNQVNFELHYSGCLYIDTTQCETIKLRIGGLLSGVQDWIWITQILLQYSTSSPTENPTTSPSIQPSVHPTQSPSNIPSLHPTQLPSMLPSISPTSVPTTFMPTKVEDGKVDVITTNVVVTETMAGDEIANINEESSLSILSLVLYIVIGIWLCILLIIGIICYRRKKVKGGYIQDTNIEKTTMNMNKFQSSHDKKHTIMSVSMDTITMDDILTPIGHENNILNMKSARIEMNDMSKSNGLNNDSIDNGDIVTAGRIDEGETPMGDDNIPVDDFIVHSNDEETLQ